MKRTWLQKCAQRWLGRNNHATHQRKVKSATRLRLEALEDRLAPAVTAAFAVDTLTVQLDAANDHAIISFENSNFRVEDGNGALIYGGTNDSVARVNVLDAATGGATNQQVTFGGPNTITATGGGNLNSVTVTDIETANVSQLIEVITISGNAGTVNVAIPGRIQHGVDFAAIGATVNVAAGTYVEDLEITTANLELAGAGVGTTTIKGVATNLQTSFPLATPNINILAAGVSIHDFTIESPNVPAGSYSSGIVIDSPGVQIFGNAFVSIQGDTPPAGPNDSLTNVIIQTWAGANSGKASNLDGLTITNNTFAGNGKGYYGVFVNPQGEAVGTALADRITITGNTFTGNIWRAVEVERSNALIADNQITPGSETLHAWGGSGISVRDFGTATINDVTISGNTVAGAGSAGQGFANGILLGFSTDTLTNIQVEENFVNNHDVGVSVNVGTTGVTVFNNHLADNNTAVHNADAAALNASGNWWGSNDENAILAMITGPVDFTPFLNTGTDTNGVTAGFQGDFSTLVVSALGEQTGLTARIQEGINRVDAGGTVQIRTGTYAGNVDATATGTNKAVTLAPGAGPGQVTIDGDVTLDANDTLEFELNGTIAGTQFDQFRIIGTNRTVTLGNAELDVVLNFSPAQGNSFVLIDNVDSSSTVSGVFNHNGTPLNEGDTFSEGGQAFRISYQGGDGNDVVLTVVLTTVTAPQDFFVVGADAGASPTVQVYDTATRELITSFLAYGAGFTGGVHVALGDVNGDFVPDIITGAGPGGGPHVKVFDGQTFTEIRSFMAYDVGFTGGVFVATGDINTDGFADIITGAGPGGGPHVKVFDGNTGVALRSFFAYGAAFRGGVSVGAGDFNGDFIADIVTGAGPGGGPHVKVFDGNTTAEIASFFAYNASFNGGVFVAANNFSGDGQVDLITGAGAGGGPHVKVFDGDNLNNTLASFLAYDATVNDGVRVASQFINADARAELITGRGGLSHVKLFDAATLNEIDSFFAFTNNVGVFVG